jgi:hypothetical protein
LATDPFDPFSHSLQAEAVVPASGIEAAAVIAQIQANLPFVEGKLRVELAGLRVTQGVGQDFLSDAQQILFLFWRQFP